jgi:hypothetical protein
MPAAAVRLAHRLGRRGAVLSLKGLMAGLYGYGILVQPIVDRSGLRLVLAVMPITWWGWAWVLAGVTAIVCAWRRQGWDWVGFTAIYLVVVPWSLSYLAAWAVYGTTPRGWVAAAIWAAFGGVTAVCAAWPEPVHAPERE